MEALSKVKTEIREMADRAYCDYINQLRRDECLGWEAKVRTGKFTEKELKAHQTANELLGQHKGLHAALRLINGLSDLHAEVVKERDRHESNANVWQGQLLESRKQLAAAEERERGLRDIIQWLEDATKASPTGISFDYCKYAEGGYVLEKGFRFMRKHFLGDRADTLIKAIHKARAILPPQ